MKNNNCVVEICKYVEREKASAVLSKIFKEVLIIISSNIRNFTEISLFHNYFYSVFSHKLPVLS